MKIRFCVLLAIVAMCGVAFATSAFAAGKPVRPGNATADGFIPSSGCGCHAPLVDQWSQSVHSKAIVDPVFLTKVDEAQAAVGDDVASFCKRCHSPIGNMIGDPAGTADPAAAEGVTCMFCHQVVGVDGKPANTSQLVAANLTRRAQLKDPAAPHPASYSELHTKAEFCGACHNVDHPINGTHLETSYTEWAEGPYAKEGTVCQDCHMSSKPGVVGPSSGTACGGGPQRDNLFSMTFVGANVGQGPADASRALLKSAATIELSVPEIVPGGSTASVTVTVTNSGAGHYLPTGLTEVRQMWLSVVSESVDGSTTILGERRFGTVMKDAKGTYPAEMWHAVGVQSDDRIPPRGSVFATYSFSMPQGAKQATVSAVLSYKSVPDDLAAKAKVDNPTTEMATGSKLVFASQSAKDAAPTPPPVADSSGPLIAAAAVAVLVIGIGIGVGLFVRSRKT